MKKHINTEVEGKYDLELNFVEKDRVYLSFWDCIHGQDICCQIKDGKLYKFAHSPSEIEADELEDTPKIDNIFKQKEVSFSEFIDLVKDSILSQRNQAQWKN